MKEFLIISAIMIIFAGSVYAEGAGYEFSDGGLIYSNVTIPVSIPKAKYANSKNNEIIPVSQRAKNNEIDIKKLSSSTSSKVDILGLVDIGDAGINQAAKNGNIKTIDYVEYGNEKLYIPLLFIPIYLKRNTTKVYGE